MNFLLERPWFMAAARWVWADDESSAVSAKQCVETLPLMYASCWSGLVVKALGVAIILGSCLNKLPVILNLLDSKSTVGLSRGSLYGDAIIYANGAFYGLLEGHPLTAFGENVAMLIQTIVIIFLVWSFASKPVAVSMQERGLAALVGAAYTVSVTSFLPADQHFILMAAIWPVYIYARGSQMLETFKIKHTGAQSIATIGMSLAGSLIRVLTTIKEVGIDFAVLTGYGLGVLLNLILFLQFFAYRSNTKAFLKELKGKKQS
jgi:mannose-P-dolichol utilization defect protein 1